MDSRYSIVEIFKSLQGEGRNTGRQCVFVRFAGCNLACEWCDTDIESRFELSLPELEAEVRSHDCDSVILTGGEPTCVGHMDELVAALKSAGLWLAVETNGTNSPAWLERVDYVACSPKLEYPESIALKAADEVRVVASDGRAAEFCRWVRQRISATDYYVSPCERNGEIDFATAKDVLSKLRGWSLSVQLHKILGFR